MTGELDRSQTSTSHVTLLKQPPNSRNHIAVSSDAIRIIGETARLNPDERTVVAQWLPTILLGYYQEHGTSAVPTEKQTEIVFKIIRRFQKDAKSLLSEGWIRRTLIRRRYEASLKGLEAPTSEQHDVSLSDARGEVEAQIEGMKQLVEDLSLLPCDPVLKTVTAKIPRSANSENAALNHLGGLIQIVWTRQLRRPLKIGPKSKYVAFAQSIYGLVGMDSTSFETLKSRLLSAKSRVEDLSR